MKRKKLVLITAILAGVMAAGTLTAYATIFSTSPTLSLSAHRGGGYHRILGTGQYSYAMTPLSNRNCGGLKGHTVSMYTNTFIGLGSSTTMYQGMYRIASPVLPAGRYHVHTRVPGRISGHYGNTFICTDATSPGQTVVLPVHH